MGHFPCGVARVERFVNIHFVAHPGNISWSVSCRPICLSIQFFFIFRFLLGFLFHRRGKHFQFRERNIVLLYCRRDKTPCFCGQRQPNACENDCKGFTTVSLRLSHANWTTRNAHKQLM